MAGMKSGGDLSYIADADVGGESIIKLSLQDGLANRHGRLEVSDLIQGMDAGIRASGSDNFDPPAEHIFRRLAQLALHGPGIGLLLPAAVTGPFVLDDQFPLGHVGIARQSS